MGRDVVVSIVCVFLCVGSYLCNVFLCVLSSVAIILLMKREFFCFTLIVFMLPCGL